MPRSLPAFLVLLVIAACSGPPARRVSTPSDGGLTEDPVDCLADDDCTKGTCQDGRCVEAETCVPKDGTLAFECECQSPDQCFSDRCTTSRCDAADGDARTASAYPRFLGERLAFDCPPNASRGSLWGTDVYTLDSNICEAGIHAGLFTREAGGRVVIEIRPGRDAYQGSTRNGVTSRDWGAYPNSFTVLQRSECVDGVKGGEEGDVDCGRGCSLCELGRTCAVDDDCESGHCGDGVCEAPRCSNERLDEGESDVDCGHACTRCQLGRTCVGAADCTSGHCEEGVCALPLCSNGRLDEGESDVDCAGACVRCDTGRQCGSVTDCRAGNECRDGLCAIPFCADGVQGQAETDVDCGGSDCKRCRAGQSCVDGMDCSGGRCDEGTCAVASCSNEVKDGRETGADCGGPVCAPCPLDQGCAVPADCESRTCTNRLCVAAGDCVNNVQDGDESDVDCGGSCAPCGGGMACVGHEDCAATESCDTNVCAVPVADAHTSLMWPSRNVGSRWTFQCPPDLATRSVWGVDAFTADSSICTAAVHAGLHDLATGGVVTVEARRGQAAYAGSTAHGVTSRSYGPYSDSYAFVPPGPCANGVRDGSESDVDCGGETCAKCDVGAVCGGDSDCASGLCYDGHCAD